MKLFFCFLFLAGVMAFACATSTNAQCFVRTMGGNLNVRVAPNGRVVGRLVNGTNVTVLDSMNDRNGDPWTRVRSHIRGSLVGWVASEFVICR